MRTSTPVASVKALVLAFHASSSPFTKGTQRSRRSEAPDSGSNFAAADCASARSGFMVPASAALAATPAVPASSVLRLIVILLPP